MSIPQRRRMVFLVVKLTGSLGLPSPPAQNGSANTQHNIIINRGIIGNKFYILLARPRACTAAEGWADK